MSNLTDDEVDRVLQQLIDQTAPDRPSDDEAQAVVKWATEVRISQVMLEMVLAGEATVRIRNGEAAFKLTPAGMTSAEALLASSPSARELHDQLVAEAAGTPLSKGPNEKQ